MENRELKLNYKNTLIIGLAFLGILMLWQVYNTYCPIILDYLLKSHFDASKDYYYITGVIMALDNLVALIIMPIFGNLSDKTNTKYGKRMPYILIGSILSALIFPFIAITFIINSLVGVVITMCLILVIMQSYRSPAVALMPDLTPKPLRSSANGIINLVGYFGAIIAAVLGMVFKIKDDTLMSEAASIALVPFIVTSVVMLVITVVLAFKIKENKLLEEMKPDLELGEELAETIEKVEEDKPLSKQDKRNMWILILSIFFWFMAFNSVETFNSLFCTKILNSSGVHGTFTIILTFSSVLTFALLTPISKKIGRKKTVALGLCSLILGFLVMSIFAYTLDPEATNNSFIVIYLATVFVGMGWALVNVNSYPMLVELASGKNIGKFTGYYYGASMLAQSITPILVGLIMSSSDIGLKALYVYACIFMIVALLTFMLIKENKEARLRAKNASTKKGFAALDQD